MTPHEREVMQMALAALEIYGAQAPDVDETIEILRTALAQPEPAECDGGQCGIGGYCKECPKPLVKLKEMLEVQGRNGTWNYDPYFHGMYNGMEFMVALAEGRDPVFREAPEKWLFVEPQREWVGLTDEEINVLFKNSLNSVPAGVIWNISRTIEAKLKEKNT